MVLAPMTINGIEDKMKIVSNFTFFNELDLLEIRLATEYDHVDRFVIVESSHTFTGLYKGYNLEANKERYAKWWDKVVYLQIGEAPPNTTQHKDSWYREYWSREQFHSQWGDLGPDDVVIISDLDELVRPEAIDYIRNTDHGFYRLSTPYFCYKLNNVNVIGHNPWNQVKAFRGHFVPGMDGMRRINNGVPGKTSVELTHAGWHFAYLGGRDKILEKIRSFAHTENNTPHITDRIQVDNLIGRETCHWNESLKFKTVQINDYFPKYLVDNIDKFADYIHPDTTNNTVQNLIPGNIPNVLGHCSLWN